MGNQINLPNRSARRKFEKRHKETYAERCKRIAEAIDMGKRIQAIRKEDAETAELENNANKNAAVLESFVEKFGEEKGTEMYNNNLELKNGRK